MHADQPRHPAASLRDLYPNLTDAEIAEAEENFTRYLEVVLRIYDRVHNDPDAIERWRALTGTQLVPYDESERSNPTEHNLSSHP